MAAPWLDLIDPTSDEVLAVLPVHVDPEVVEARTPEGSSSSAVIHMLFAFMSKTCVPGGNREIRSKVASATP